MFHAKVNDKVQFDLEWDGKSSQGKINGEDFVADMIGVGQNKTHWILKNRSFVAEVVDLNHETKEAVVKVNGHVYPVQLKDRYDDLLKSLGMEGAGSAKLKDLKAPMPGLVLDILVKEGDAVEKDTPLLILEAMKMENVIKCPAPGSVKKIIAIKGKAVEKNQVLIDFA